RIRCTECHSAGTILQNRFDEKGWRNVLDVMEHTDYYGVLSPDHVSATIRYHKEELIPYLARMRGPDPSPMRFKPYPRPHGEAARVVITEYDIPPGETPDSLITSDGSDWQEGTPSIDGVGPGVHDVHVDFEGNAWAVDSGLNTGRTFMKIDTKTGVVTGFKVPAPPDGRFARGSHAIITDPKGILWMDVRANAGLTGFGSLGRLDPKTEEFALFTPSEEMSTGINRTLDWDGLGRIWASTSSGAIMFDPETQQFKHYPAVTPGGAIASYGVAGDAEGNGWWTQSGQDIVAVADTRTGKVHEIRMQPRTDLKDLITEEDRKFYGKRIVWAEQQYPRRLGADKNGKTVWVPNFVGENLARIDTETYEVKYYRVPFNSHPYYVVVDKNHMVWTNLMTNDRVAKFNPKTEEWTIFVLPSRGGETRNIAVDNTRDPVEIWVPYFRTSRVARLQFRSQEQLERTLAQLR
ncbi:MAG TPA: hypothetical protein VKZ59_14610, partial [Acidobacteriota bacterium]|nr:hypothetical protein [Acidobacteriota bacterium]